MSALTPDTVLACIAEVLGDGRALRHDTALLDVPGFTSIVVADLVERLEEELGVEVPPGLIVPETFETPAAIATALGALATVTPATVTPGTVTSGAARPLATAGAPAAARAPRFLHELVDAAADRDGARVAIRAGDDTLTYGQLRDRSVAAARWLASNDVTRGDRVVVGLGNVADTLVALHALSRLGAVFVPVDPATPAWSLGHVITDAEPVLAIGALDAAVAAAGGTVKVRPWPTELPAVEPGWRPASGAISADPACILYTSGSTGLPKGIVCPHRSMLFAADAIGARIDVDPDDVIGCVLPLTFDYGLYQALLATRVGAAIALGSATDAGPSLLAFLERHGVTGLPLIPSLGAGLAQLLARRAPDQRPRLRWASNTGAALAPALADRLRALVPGMAVYLMYGLTECKRVSILLPSEYDARPTSVGRPLDDTEVVIVDPATGSPCAPDEVGEIVVRGPHIMAGYRGVPADVDRRFRVWGDRRELALFSGDLGHLDAEGYLYFDGRHDEVYKVSGFRVSTIEVELAAADVDGVDECVVLPPQATDDQPAVLVTTGSATVAEVRAGLTRRLDAFKVPERIVAVDRLPHNGNGKVDRRAVAEMPEVAR